MRESLAGNLLVFFRLRLAQRQIFGEKTWKRLAR
jgi:hypothetical protein